MTRTNNQPNLLNFQQLRREKGLTSGAVAEAAGVSLREEYLFEIGGIVDEEIKRKILKAFEQLTGKSLEEQPTLALQKTHPSLKLIGGEHDLY